ncbi:MAG: hypothetical protein ACD_5C00075G0016, partial [uncultured bacterium]
IERGKDLLARPMVAKPSAYVGYSATPSNNSQLLKELT